MFIAGSIAVPEKRKQRGRGRPFQKGNTASVGIKKRNKLKPEIVEFKKMKYQEFLDKLQEFGGLTKNELREVIQDEKTTVFESIFGRVLFEAMNGNLKAVDIIFTRLWGKPKETDQPLLDENESPKVQIFLPDNGRDTIIDVGAKSDNA